MAADQTCVLKNTASQLEKMDLTKLNRQHTACLETIGESMPFNSNEPPRQQYAKSKIIHSSWTVNGAIL